MVMRKQMIRMMMLGAVVFAALGWYGLSGAQRGRAQDVLIYNPCPYSDAEFYQAGIFPRYEFRNQQLLLINWETGAEIALEMSLNVPEFRVINWSPNCRYVFGWLAGQGYAVWDVITRTRAGSIAVNMPNAAPIWDARSQYLIIPAARQGTYLWEVPANRQTLINENPCGFWEAMWDHGRGQVIAVAPLAATPSWCSANATEMRIYAYDLGSGAQVASYEAAGSGGRLSFEMTADMRYLLISNYGSNMITIWDRAGGARRTLDTGEPLTHNSRRIALSPDGRFLALARAGGLEIAVWDAFALNDAMQAPLFVYGGPEGRIRQLDFIDGLTLQTTTAVATQRWDVLTGAELATE
jgi:hypothetical protein